MKTHVDKQDRETYKCDYEDCGRIYFYKRNLVYHINSFHKHIKNKIPCPHEGCDKLLSKKVCSSNLAKLIKQFSFTF